MAKIKINNPTSRDIQNVISQTNFIAQGATGTIEFSLQGDRKGKNIELVTVTDCESQTKVFVSLDRQQCF